MDIFQAIADETRRTILDELSARNGQTLFEICSVLAGRHGIGLTRQAISHHLAVLEAAGLLITEKRGRHKFHFIDTGPLAQIEQRWRTPSEENP